MNIYTGIGSRRTPANILAIMTALAAKLLAAGWGLRSGGAAGADSAFAAGVSDPSKRAIYRPEHVTQPALDMASQLHPAWKKLPLYTRRLHARNCYQVLGLKLDNPSKFIVCYTPDGAVSEADCSVRTGGTATAIKLASRRGIPVFNLRRPDHLERIQKFISA